MRWEEKNIHEFERNYVNVIFGSNRAFHLFLIVSFFLKAGHIRGQDGTLCQIWNSEENTYWTVKLLSVILKYNSKQIFPEITPPYVVL